MQLSWDIPAGTGYLCNKAAILSATIKGTHCINQSHNIVLVLDTVTVVDTFTRNEKVGTFLIENFTLEIEWKYNILNSCDLKS